ncbi:MAG: hypothetical protein ACO1OB_26365 [Archangium sp.]
MGFLFSKKTPPPVDETLLPRVAELARTVGTALNVALGEINGRRPFARIAVQSSSPHVQFLTAEAAEAFATSEGPSAICSVQNAQLRVTARDGELDLLVLADVDWLLRLVPREKLKRVRFLAIALVFTSCVRCEAPRTTKMSAKHLDVINGEACDTNACTAPLTCLTGSSGTKTCRLVCRNDDDCPEGFGCVKFVDGPGAGHFICNQLRR